MKRLRAFINRYAFSEDLPLEAKAINVLYLCGTSTVFLALMSRVITGTNRYVVIAALLIILAGVFLMYISNRFRLYTLCSWLTVILVCDIMLPAVYFFLGGVASGATSYFVVSMVIVFLVFRGKYFFIALVTHILVVFSCYYLSYRYPGLTLPPGESIFQGDFRAYFDHIQSFLIAGACVGIIVKFQRKVYLMEKHKEILARRNIQQQDQLLLAVNDAVAMLFAPDMERFEDSLNKSMEIIAGHTGVDRIFIWKIQTIDGVVHYQPIFQWAKVPSLRITANLGFPTFISEQGSAWAAQFSRGASINGLLSSFPPVLREFFAPYGALSVLAVPIFLQEQPWGFISFDDCDQERRFPSQVESILKSSSLLIASAIIRNEMTQSLIQAKEDALASARAKSDFLARMSHEIRTPLNAVLGLSEVELQGSLPERTRVNLEKIHRSGSHLLEIVNDILDISKIESGNFEIVPAEYELYEIINDVIQINILRIGIKPIEFKLEIDETVPSKLYGDKLRIKQVLNNILSNAFKYTEEGRVRLTITWEKMEDTALIGFAVEDTGRGIKPEDLEKLFAEYTQFETAANRRIEGTGLGLSIAKGLAETMGGSIVAESEYGKGSVFLLQLPQRILDQTPVGAEQAENLRNLRFNSNRSRGRGSNLIRSSMPYGKVLVVDDLETNLDVMTGLLMPYGLRVDTVLSGQEAVERIRAEEVRYDLVFMDHMMPGMDGIEAARIIRNEIGSDYARQVAMVALTANAISGMKEMFLNCGFTDFISKPIDIYHLDMLLNRW
ncbi:MAG: response regulator, partial [Treponema sp.]|nr:response regulator [Treponema sp.]